jgi:hypothetical protein
MKRYRPTIIDNAVHKHAGSTFAKLGPAVWDGGHRRVLTSASVKAHTPSTWQPRLRRG